MQTTIAILRQSNPGCVSASWRLLCPALGLLLLVYCLPKHSKHSNHSVRAFLHIASIGTTSAPWTPLATDPPSRHSMQPCLVQSYCQSSFSFKILKKSFHCVCMIASTAELKDFLMPVQHLSVLFELDPNTRCLNTLWSNKFVFPFERIKNSAVFPLLVQKSGSFGRMERGTYRCTNRQPQMAYLWVFC